MGLTGDFALCISVCIFSQEACVWFVGFVVFFFVAIVIPQPWVIAGRQLQNNESLATSTMKVL